ncbi:Lipopolysaccharide export system ATP-binding protein LptB [bacterium HR39]|nr:Lipopolysaccharide export system ATP-binding protein LptB [bacterium HR39]
MNAVLEVRGVSKSFGGVVAAADLDVTVERGEIVGIIGANGAGKTTLMRAICGLLLAARGRVVLDGRDVTRLPAHRRARLGVGYMPEDRRLVPQLPVRDNILLPLWARGVADAEARLAEVLRFVPDIEPFLARPALRLSGGQQKLVALARALAAGERVLLLDEPFEGVAPALARRLAEILESLGHAGQRTILVSGSDYTHTAGLVDRLYAIERGRVEPAAPTGAG